MSYAQPLAHYGREYDRYIVCTSFSGKDADKIGVFKVRGRFYSENGAVKFEVPQANGGCFIYTAEEVYADLEMAKYKYKIQAIAAMEEINLRMHKLVAGFR